MATATATVAAATAAATAAAATAAATAAAAVAVAATVAVVAAATAVVPGSGRDGDCVEVADDLADTVAVRDTENRAGGVLVSTHDRWSAFLAGVKRGEFGVTG
ncbi:DUF397 domain-containing protein [Actinoplanes sp. L3-i22]|uniref:DUF397 domain-containing protein n=1 Tax=Actinoplanes sp. L3-i22 TaxID=2836373 RepID=UPI001C85F9F1